jgi:hypothetical protein
MSGWTATTVLGFIRGATEDGKTPMQTLASKQIVEAKMLERQYEDKIADKEKNEIEYGESPPPSEVIGHLLSVSAKSLLSD